MTASRRRIAHSDLEVFPYALGTNSFGWTADEETSHAVLDEYVKNGGNFIDTADSYPFWAPGRDGGESETIIGHWLASSGSRDDLVIATKVSQHPDFKGLAPETINAGVDASLQRLGIDVIDLYYAHFDDPDTPLVESIGAMWNLVDIGKVRHIAISNYSADRVEEWLKVTEAESFPKPVALQPQYSLVERGIEETTLPIARSAGLAVIPYYVLARGFLTGKYAEGAKVDSPRAEIASGYLDDRGRRVLAALGEIADNHGVEMATVALAWVAAQPGVVAPLASARNTDQLPALIAHTQLTLGDDEITALTEASDPN